nr:hypothetical protein [Neisseria gonorrhoeae]
MNKKLALMPLLILSAFSSAADNTPQHGELGQVHVRADAKRASKPRILTPSPAMATCATA